MYASSNDNDGFYNNYIDDTETTCAKSSGNCQQYTIGWERRLPSFISYPNKKAVVCALSCKILKKILDLSPSLLQLFKGFTNNT